MRYCAAYALEHCADDLAYLENEYPDGEKGLRARLLNVVESDFAHITYTGTLMSCCVGSICHIVVFHICMRTVLRHNFFKSLWDTPLSDRSHFISHCLSFVSADAIELLQRDAKAKKVKFEKFPNWGDDLGSEHERYMAEKVRPGRGGCSVMCVVSWLEL